MNEMDTITIDGTPGTVFIGDVPTVKPKKTKDFETILGVAQKIKK